MKSTSRKSLLLALLLTLSMLLPLLAASPVLSRRVGVNGAAFNVQASATSDFQYLLLKETVALWSDGRGDVILERRLENENIDHWTSITWYFDWYPGDYSNIRAWDDEGPLDFSTHMSGTRIYVTVYFRNSVAIGANYHFYLAITIGNMSYESGDEWIANWYTKPGQPVQEFVLGVTFPSNSTITSVTPDPTIQHLNYLEWRARNTPSDWVHTIEVHYALSSVINVPLFLQTSFPWKDDPYGNYPKNDHVNTINKWGCYTTSAAMIIDYWGQRSSPQFRTNPGDFNAWLRDNNGYDAGNNVVHSKIIEYAQNYGVSLYLNGYIIGRDDAVLDSYLLSGNPVIIGVNKRIDPETGRPYASHFVVATGKTMVSGHDTYVINDPFYGQTTLYERWNNDYYSILLLSGTAADKRTLYVSAHSPVELLVTDSLGRKIGYDPRTDTAWNEIPKAEYFIQTIAAEGGVGEELPKSKIMLINAPLDGEYALQILGTDEGAYEVDVLASDWIGRVSKITYTGIAQNGSSKSQTIEYSSYTGLYSAFIYLPIVRIGLLTNARDRASET